MKTKINEKTNKKGISLIVLVITIIVMIILAATVIISLSNNGIIGKANEAVEQTNLKQVQTIAQTIWAEGQLTKDDPATIKSKIIAAIGGEDVAGKYTIEVDENGVTVNIKNEDKTAPTLTITAPESSDVNNPTIVNTATYTVTGKVEDEGGIKSITVNETELSITEEGLWSYDITLTQNETTTITIVATDISNNVKTEIRYACYVNNELGDNPSTNTYYLYNEFGLPDINSVWTDKETYPYAYIEGAGETEFGFTATLVLTNSNPFHENNDENCLMPAPYSSKTFIFAETQEVVNAYRDLGLQIDKVGEWWFYETKIDESTVNRLWVYPQWTSNDIMNTDGTVYLAASDPVPVEN